MARNRNRVLHARGAGSVMPFSFAALLIAGTLVALAYVSLWGRCNDMGRRIKQAENRRDDLVRQLRLEESRYANLTSQSSLKRLIDLHRLPMVWPPESSIVRVRRAAPEWTPGRAPAPAPAATPAPAARAPPGPRDAKRKDGRG